MESADTVLGTALHWADLLVIVVYFLFVLFIGLWSSRSNRGSVDGYFLAGRNMHWIPVGASIFASNIGSIHFVGLAGSGANSGIGVGTYELNAIFIVLMLGWLFLPVYIASGVSTMPEYLRLRFGGSRIRVMLALLALLLYIFTKVSSDLYAGAIFIEQSLRWDMYASIFALLAIAALFTITGGLTAVVWTDFVQTILMLVGAVALSILGFVKIGGYSAMVEKYPAAVAQSTLLSNSTCNLPREDSMNLFRDPVTGDLPWPGIVGVMINSLWYWCADQVIVQRALAAKNFTHAKAGTVLAGFLKILPLFTLVFPGMIARILYPDTVGCADSETCYSLCGSKSGCSNIAYPTLVIKLMPHGARGLMLAVMLAALMSSLTSIFNSSSTIFTVDIWSKIRSQALPREQMIVGRVFVLVLVGLSIVWVPIIKQSQGTELFVYIQEISSFLQPPIIAVFIAGIFWSRATEKGAFCGLLVGITTGIVRFGIQYSFQAPTCDDPTDYRLKIITDFHYLYFGTFLFVFTFIVIIVVSVLTKPIHEKHLQRLTFMTRKSKKERVDIDSEPVEQNETGIEEEDKGNAKPADEAETTPSKIPWYKLVLLWICGIDREVKSTKTDLEQARLFKEHLSLTEKPVWHRVCDVAAIILIVIGVFLFGVWA